MRLAIVVLSIAGLGCGGGKKECSTDAEALTKLLRDAPHDPEWFPLSGRHLVSRTEPSDQKIAAHAPVIDIRKGETVYQGQLSSPEDLRERLTLAHQKLVEDAMDPLLVYFVIDADATWGHVVAAFDAAEAAGMTKPTFVFEQPMTVSPPPKTALDVEIDRMVAVDGVYDNAKMEEIGSKIREKTKDCASLNKLYEQIGAMETGDKAEALLAELPAALMACECKVDMPQLRSNLWRLLVPQRITRGFPFSPGVREQTIALPATTSWAEASKQFVRPLRGAKLVAR
jgi:hypothetical protein